MECKFRKKLPVQKILKTWNQSVYIIANGANTFSESSMQCKFRKWGKTKNSQYNKNLKTWNQSVHIMTNRANMFPEHSLECKFRKWDITKISLNKKFLNPGNSQCTSWQTDQTHFQQFIWSANSGNEMLQTTPSTKKSKTLERVSAHHGKPSKKHFQKTLWSTNSGK